MSLGSNYYSLQFTFSAWPRPRKSSLRHPLCPTIEKKHDRRSLWARHYEGVTFPFVHKKYSRTMTKKKASLKGMARCRRVSVFVKILASLQVRMGTYCNSRTHLTLPNNQGPTSKYPEWNHQAKGSKIKHEARNDVHVQFKKILLASHPILPPWR